MQRWLLERADANIVTTSAYAESSPWLRPFQDKIRIIPIGIQEMRVEDEALLCGAVKAIRQRYSNRRIVFALGRLTYYKGFDVLVPAVRRLPSDVQVVIGGGGKMAEEIAALSRSEGVADRVHLVSPLDREQVLLHHPRVRHFRVRFLGKCLFFQGLCSSWVFFVMARFEGFPMTLYRFSG